MESIQMRKNYRGIVSYGLGILLLACWSYGSLRAQDGNAALNVKINPADGSYALAAPGATGSALRAGVGAEIDGHWLQSKDYPRHTEKHSQVVDDLGPAEQWEVRFSGFNGEPDLVYRLSYYPDKPFADIQVSVDNTTTKSIRCRSDSASCGGRDSHLRSGRPGHSRPDSVRQLQRGSPGHEHPRFRRVLRRLPQSVSRRGHSTRLQPEEPRELFRGSVELGSFSDYPAHPCWERCGWKANFRV